MSLQIVLLPGDGIGPEVTAQSKRVLEAISERHGHDLTFDEELVGGAAIDRTGAPLPDETLSACRRADAVLLGAVGGPRWDHLPTRPEHGLLRLRKELAVFANLRPVRVHKQLQQRSPLKSELLSGVDLLVVRELTGGLYFGQPKRRESTEHGERAVDTLAYDEHEIRRVVRLAFELARGRKGRVTSIDKANVLQTGRLWREVATSVASEFPNVQLDHQLVDAAAMRLMTNPRAFDVIVTSNMFGDILTDEASVLSGSLGMLPSASVGESTPGLYEPVHGSAPDIAGRGIANPIGCILSAALLLRHSAGLVREANVIERAVQRAIAAGARTRDIGGELSCEAMGDVIVGNLFDDDALRPQPGAPTARAHTDGSAKPRLSR